MEEYRLIVDLVIALGAALLGGAVAQRLGQPVLIGYIVAGILIGPNTPGLVAEIANVETLASLGVAFLMFTIGVELSFSELRRVRYLAIFTGGLQIPLTIAVGLLAGLAIGWSWQAAAVLGGCFAISSTIVLLKLSASRGEANSPMPGPRSASASSRIWRWSRSSPSCRCWRATARMCGSRWRGRYPRPRSRSF